ncbi:hypothetical protein RDWZM_005042, partial [Blomia tropicalis]
IGTLSPFGPYNRFGWTTIFMVNGSASARTRNDNRTEPNMENECERERIERHVRIGNIYTTTLESS